LREQLDEARKMTKKLQKNQDKLEAEKAGIKDRLEQLVNSKSWRATQPFRDIAAKARSFLDPAKG
jgi:hypothetical protein